MHVCVKCVRVSVFVIVALRVCRPATHSAVACPHETRNCYILHEHLYSINTISSRTHVPRRIVPTSFPFALEIVSQSKLVKNTSASTPIRDSRRTMQYQPLSQIGHWLSPHWLQQHGPPSQVCKTLEFPVCLASILHNGMKCPLVRHWHRKHLVDMHMLRFRVKKTLRKESLLDYV